MKKRLAFLLLMLVVGMTAEAYNNTYALIIGVADYRNFTPDDGDLNYTVNGAISFAAFLKSKKGGSVPATNIVLLTEAQASKENIIAKGKALFAKAKKDDRVIFYFSGHGDKGCFLPYDATTMGGNLLYFSEVKSIFKAAKCNTKLLFADACFAGSMKKGLSSNNNLRKSLEKGHKDASNMNIAVMMSCQGNETSMEMGSLQQGLFTYYLMEGLGGAANRDGNRYVTIQELYYYVYHKVQDKAASRGHKQTPDLFGKFDLRLIVAKV
ncbi:MAG: caspase family protein [Bacteroidales bacterium]|nr:caspase family protein [Bacteroidales bacterium]